MAKIKFNDLFLHKAVLEVKYPRGYRYWDICGKTILDLRSATKDDLDFKELLGGEECMIHSNANPLLDARFGYKRILVSATNLSDTALLEEMGSLLFDTVCRNIELAHIDRVGFRQWYVYPTATHAAALAIVNKLDLVTIDQTRLMGFGDAVKAILPHVIMSDGDKQVSITIAAARRQSPLPPNISENDKLFTPEQCVLLDVDSHQENMKAEDIDLASFIHICRKTCKDNVFTLLNPGG